MGVGGGELKPHTNQNLKTIYIVDMMISVVLLQYPSAEISYLNRLITTGELKKIKLELNPYPANVENMVSF
jgi:hypothetical protein